MSKSLEQHTKAELIEIIQSKDEAIEMLDNELENAEQASESSTELLEKTSSELEELRAKYETLEAEHKKLSKRMVGDQIEVTLSGHWKSYKPNQTVLVSIEDYKALRSSGGIKNIRS